MGMLHIKSTNTTLNLLSVTSFSVQCPNVVSSRIIKDEVMKKLTVV